MSRPSRNDRSPAHAKSRPKRRAASTHLFKYQLAGDPNRVEENALKKALQESLDDHKSAHTGTVVTSNKSMNNNHSKNNRVIGSSTNSSDVSGTSNNSSSTSNESRDFLDVIAAKRTRSSVASPIVTPPSKKRAKHTTVGYKQNIIKGDKCDSDPGILTGSPPPPFNKAIKTYSRTQLVNGDHELRPHRQKSSISPRSSTPISKKQTKQHQDKTTEETKSEDIQVLSKPEIQVVSKSTQTSTPTVNLGNTQISELNVNDGDLRKSQSPERNSEKVSKSLSTPKDSPPVQEQYLKFKRESKNYAYAKMTALKVNTYKSPYSINPKMPSKKSPTGVLNNNTNKLTGKSSPKGVGTSTSSQTRSNNSEDDRRQAGNDPSLIVSKSVHNGKSSDSRASTKHVQATHPVAKSIPNQSSFSAQMLRNARSSNNTIDLSAIKNQNQSSVNLTRKRIAQGSWSLLGIPEEKIIYLRDDEPARRLICYPAIKHIEGDVIQVRDSVLLRSGAKKTDLPYIAKVCAFWEDAETGGVMMGLFWYYRPEHTEEGRRPHHLPDEIFASRHRDVDSVECIEDKCYVLTFNEYCRYKKRVKMEQVSTTWSLTDVTIPVSNESYPRRNRIPDTNVNPELVFCCRQIYDSRMKRLMKNPLINPKYGHI